MPRQIPLPPSAASLTASLRDLGYSLETAVADIVDNSISANATDIQIVCDIGSEVPAIVIADNGSGMTEEEVIAAMRPGSTSPKQERSESDLGRFGLGLKTASFSQCKRLTVVSRKEEVISSAEWDLNLVEEINDWTLIVLDSEDIRPLPYRDLLKAKGTLIIWRDLDRLFQDEKGIKRDELVYDKLKNVDRHLSLVFHRFLSGEIKGRDKLTISINGKNIDAFDPFCRKNSATQILAKEKVWIGDSQVELQPYILPHYSRLSASEEKLYKDRSDFVSNQGAYVYRNGRLMAWGDWFRIATKGESTKLARVQIDFPNSLDEKWGIDIKKSRTSAPPAVRERLRQILGKVTARSINIHRGRGQKLLGEYSDPLWNRYADHALGIKYTINRDHPLISDLVARLPKADMTLLNLIFESISSALPYEMIYSDYSTQPREVGTAEVDEDQLLSWLQFIKEGLFKDGYNEEHFRKTAKSTGLFQNREHLIDQFIQRSGNDCI